MVRYLAWLTSSLVACLVAVNPATSSAEQPAAAPSAINLDDECSADTTGSQCALNALQRRGLKKTEETLSTDADATKKSLASLSELWAAASCHTAVEGEECWSLTRQAMTDGIRAHPEWYPEMTALTPFEAFQSRIHRESPTKCPMPCAPALEQVAERCYTARHGDACYKAVTWARNDGIYAHPEYFPGLQPNSSSREEFQAHIHRTNRTVCPPPCMLSYPKPYSVPTYRAQAKTVIKGISYGPAPLKRTGEPLTDDDFMAENTSAQWADWGRGDLSLIKQMGANTMRMYGNDPSQNKRTFLDQAMKRDIGIVVGISDYPYMQMAGNCLRNNWYCYDQIYESYKQNLLNGFTMDGNSTYHPALKALILINEPDLKVHPRQFTCRAIITALDAVLQAEKDVGVTKNPVALTATFSFGAFDGKPPGLGQMEDFYKCIKDPHGEPTRYSPKNDIYKAYKSRWVNSFNTANPAFSVRELFLDKYAKSTFWSDEIKLPVFIGEYHSVHVGVREDVKSMLHSTRDPKYPFFMGLSFFEFSVRYDKGGTEMAFGMFGYGDCALDDMDYAGKDYTVWDLAPALDSKGDDIFEAVAAAYGGNAEPILRAGPCMPAKR